MSTTTKVILGSSGVLVVLIVAAFFFFRYQITKAYPQTTGTLRLEGLDSTVEVFRDAYGVPHVRAADEHDLMIATGFVHAQDRLWQMDLSRRAGEGRLSELFGNVTVPFDRMFRIVGIRRIAEEIERALPEDTQRRLVWYSQGVNACIRGSGGRLPFEFDALGYQPEPWTPLHSIIIARLMSWELNLSWWTDLTYGALLERVGVAKAGEVFPPYPAGVEPTVRADVWHHYAGAGTPLLEASQAYAAFMGSPAMLGGSNAWVVGPQKTLSGGILFANDTHLQLQAPSKWYEIQWETPSWTCGGFSVPGAPVVVVGSNDSIVWGLTNVMADDADFYIEQIDSTDTTRYLYDGAWRTLSFREEQIAVRGESTQTVQIRSTHHGPIVTDIHTFLRHSAPSYVASMRWTGTDVSDQIGALWAIDRAEHWAAFVAGVERFTGPAQNFVYGDRAGNIGYWCGGKIPTRGNVNPTLPLPGWEPSTEWTGYIPFGKLPHLLNPSEGYIATANNKLVDDSYPYHLSSLWEPPSRIIRLREMLGPGEGFSVEDFQRLQTDTYSHMAKDLTGRLLMALADSGLADPDSSILLEYLRNWTFEFDKENIAATLFEEFYVHLLRNTYSDEMGEEIFHDFVTLVNVPIRVTAALMLSDTSTWFDDVRTPARETRDMILRRSLRDALADLRTHPGGEMKTWRWGEIHSVTLKHPFGLVKPLDRLFNIGPYPCSGGPTTLMSNEFSINDPFTVTVGASFRMVVDFGARDEVHRVLPSGQSGQVLNPHYDDQTPLWLNGALRSVTQRVDMQSANRWEKLILEPDR